MVRHTVTSSPVIIAMGHAHPENEISNDFFESLGIGSSADWVEERTGIKSRRSVMTPEQLRAISAGQMTADELRRQGMISSIAQLALLAKGDLDDRFGPSVWQNVDTVICGTSIPDYDIPANASVIAEAAGLRGTCLDVNSACSSFVSDLHTVRGLHQLGDHQGVAIFNPERYSMKVDLQDRASCVLFGDGCSVAVVDCLGKATGGLEIIDTLVRSDPAGYGYVKIPVGGLFSQNGRAVQKFAISKTIEVTQQILQRNELAVGDIDYFLGHQANLRMVSSAAVKLGFPEDKHLYNVDRFGNQGAAGAPAVLSENWARFQPGNRILVSVVGSGLTWGAALLRCK